MNLARQVTQPRGVASAVAGCLDPAYSALYQSLSESAAAGPPMLHQAGDDEHDPERFMETWLSSIRALSSRNRSTANLKVSVDENPETRTYPVTHNL
jgi:hypothetical protein